MKMKLTLVMALLASLFFAGCGKNDSGTKGDPNEGSWMLRSWKGSEELSGKVYLRLDHGAFALYQLLNNAGYTPYLGSYTVADGRISGVYADGKPWAEVYGVTGMDTNVMTLTGVETGVVSVYVRTTIPDYVTGNQVRAAQAFGAEGDGGEMRLL